MRTNCPKTLANAIYKSMILWEEQKRQQQIALRTEAMLYDTHSYIDWLERKLIDLRWEAERLRKDSEEWKDAYCRLRFGEKSDEGSVA